MIAHTLRQALLLVFWLSLPVLLTVLIVGFASAFLQSATRLRESALSTVPKLIAGIIILAIAGSWMGGRVVGFFRTVLEAVPKVGRG